MWRIVLKVQPHPLLSGTFREQLQRDLSATLAPALGSLGTVEVVELDRVPKDRWDPLWEEFDIKGFEALASRRDLTGTKTHFLKLEYKDGRYLLESRQHDGFSGLASPVVRKESLRAPELVGRTAGLMLDRDFGLAGTVEPGPKDEAKITLRARATRTGGAIRQGRRRLRRLPGHEDQPPRPAAGPHRDRQDHRPTTRLGSASGPVGRAAGIHPSARHRGRQGRRAEVRRPDALEGRDAGRPRVAGYRCMKLGTVEQPLAVRLIGSSGVMQKTAGQVTVRGNEAGFNAPPDPRDSFEFKDGLFRSTRPFTNVACVVVALAGGEAQQYPVPILGGEPVSLQFETSLQAAEAAAFIRDATATLQRSADARHAQMICSDATAKLIDKQKNSDALARAKGGLQAADAADKSIADDLTRLKEQVALAPEGPKIVVAIEQNLKAMRGFNQKLGDHIKKLEDVVRRENDPTVGARQVQIESTVEKIKILLGGGNVEEAINAYDLLITLEPDNPDAKAQRDKLIAEWKPKSAEHAKARDYLLKTWPAIATIPDYVESLPRIGAVR